MTRFLTAAFALMMTASMAMAHCQVPCGIYSDQLRFEQMLEDEHTISKAQLEINAIAEGKMSAQAINQSARWVTTKEDHATNIQNTIAAYFMAQRIKPDSENYAKTLVAAHTVMVAAMKCKQSADPATAKALEKSIFDLYRAYEGKEPDFEHTH
ncbi:superoxide dismutase, Ni [Stieleria sp. TO1_6]|uniref:superoxide dismutase, Ni n=1 Tax=Stieleria tagensis TaxID=2956795 RepID=UPI00209B4648|nr:superoxide dismutase, Ni [Stieleria tagensis]MCO8124074.1 superoxide dismutase, Ni [Stieleria tagensis]